MESELTSTASKGDSSQSLPLSNAVWFGLVGGLAEGLTLFSFYHLGWLTWNIREALNAEIIWISAVFDLCLFLLIGILLLAFQRLFPRVPIASLAVLVFTFFGFLDLLFLTLSGRIGHLPCIVLAAGFTSIFFRLYRMHELTLNRFWKRSTPWVVALAALTFIAIQGGGWLHEQWEYSHLPAAQPGAPNILVVVTDTVRADHLSLYGYGRPTSPNIDRLGSQGVVFQNANSTSSWTLPSHASLLTGRYPFEHGAIEIKLDNRLPTIAEVLKSNGYRTAAFSANLGYFTQGRGFGRGFVRFEAPFHSVVDMAARTLYGKQFSDLILPRLGYEQVPGRKRATDVTRSFEKWARRDQDRPFFAVLNFFDAHLPYHPPQPFRSRFSKQPNPGGLINGHAGRPPSALTLTAGQVQSEMDAYDGAISFMDTALGALVGDLDRLHIGKNLVIVVVSDHGEQFMEHGMMDHRNGLYRELIHVPMILRWTGHLPSGLRIDRPVSIASIPATLLELSGSAKASPFGSPSLVPLWTHVPYEGDWPYPLAELTRLPYESAANPCKYGAMESVVTPEWHYISHQTQGEQIFHWPDDVVEAHNQLQTPDGELTAQRLSAYLKQELAQK